MPSWWLGAPAVLDHIALLRYALTALALAWALAVLRGRRWSSLAAGLSFAIAATGFWVVSLARPYGLLVDGALTRRAAEVAVSAAAGRPQESFVAGEASAYEGLSRAGVSPETLLLLASALPVLCHAAIGLLILALWRRRDEALIAACLWLAFATGDLDAVRGMGVVPGAWAHPEEALLAVAVAALALAAGRLPLRFGAALTAALALAGLLAPAPANRLAAADAVLLLTLDQGLWLALGAFGLLRAPDAASRGLVAGGAIAVLASAIAGCGGAFAGYALLRVGLLLASASGLAALPALPELTQRFPGVPAPRAALAALLALLLPGSFLVWWDPPRMDPLARGSQEAISPALAPLMAFIRDGTPKDAVFVASPDYAPSVAVFGARRVLRAPSLLVTADDSRRQRAEGALLLGRPLPPGADAHGARFLLLAPGDFRSRGIARPEDLEGRPGFVTRYADAAGYRVYEVVR